MNINDYKNPSSNLIIAIYKGKILLTSKDSLTNFREKNIWSFPDKKRSQEFGQPAEDIVSFDRQLHYIKLSDKNVFAIKRQEGKRIEFYRPSEFGSLLLSPETHKLYSRYEQEITRLLSGLE